MVDKLIQPSQNVSCFIEITINSEKMWKHSCKKFYHVHRNFMQKQVLNLFTRTCLLIYKQTHIYRTDPVPKRQSAKCLNSREREQEIILHNISYRWRFVLSCSKNCGENQPHTQALHPQRAWVQGENVHVCAPPACPELQ